MYQRYNVAAIAGRIWAITTALLTIGTAVSAILAAFTLEMLMQRPSGGGSMTTMLPGAFYAMATVMKVCLVAGMVIGAAWIFAAILRRPVTAATTHALPVWGLASVALVVSTPWIGAVGAVIAQMFAGKAAGLALGDLPHISRAGVFVQLAALVAGAISSTVSLTGQEHPRTVAIVGLATSVILIGLFWHFQFHAHGFDQDTWAPR